MTNPLQISFDALAPDKANDAQIKCKPAIRNAAVSINN
jgi:hypothetical protein